MMRAYLAVLAAALVAGCASSTRAPVVDRAPPAGPVVGRILAVPAAQAAAPRPDSYTVRRGDTLYSIALDNGLDYRDLASWNSIADANMIHEGQLLSLKAPPSEVQVRPIATPGSVQARPLAVPQAAQQPAAARAPAAADLVTEPKALKLPYSEENLALLRPKPPVPAAAVPPAVPAAPPVASQPPARPEGNRAEAKAEEGAKQESSEDALEWIWPASGKVIAGFSESGGKGVDISGKKGDAVTASAGGRVVYIGEGLRGYGKLVIIKHNDSFLSAYAHNDAILVKEGQSVVKGQKIAEIGSTGTDQTKLHFEIRQFGKPVDPLKFLPGRP